MATTESVVLQPELSAGELSPGVYSSPCIAWLLSTKGRQVDWWLLESGLLTNQFFESPAGMSSGRMAHGVTPQEWGFNLLRNTECGLWESGISLNASKFSRERTDIINNTEWLNIFPMVSPRQWQWPNKVIGIRVRTGNCVECSGYSLVSRRITHYFSTRDGTQWVREATCPIMGGANQAIVIIKVEQDMLLRFNPANSSFQKKELAFEIWKRLDVYISANPIQFRYATPLKFPQ